jgi:hypothetical protein
VQGQVGEDAVAVTLVGAAVDEAVGDHLVHELGERRLGKQGGSGDLRHRVTVSVAEDLQHAPLLERAVLTRQPRGQMPSQQPLCAAQQVGKIAR